MNQISFIQRVINDLITVAPQFKSTFIDKEYLIFSSKMINRKYYIVSTNPDNFMHLTGIKTNSPIDFYNKCINGTLVEGDINIPSQEKGNIRRKIIVLPNLINLFSNDVLFEEDFSHNAVHCSFASTDLNVTIGFCKPNENNVARPMTLLKGYSGFNDGAALVELILERKRGEELFTKILCGDKDIIINNGLASLVDPKLL